jgi:drug/metabolite transporter (DMT)-like permease
LNNRQGIVAMSVSMALFIVNDGLTKLVSERLSTDTIVFVRGLMASVLILAWILIRDRRLLSLWRHPGAKVVALRALIDAATTFSFLWALFHLPLATVTAIGLSAPLMVTALAAVFLGERVAWRRWTAIGVGFFGVLLIVQPAVDGVNGFALLALGSTFVISVRDIITRTISADIPSIVVTLATAAAVTAIAGLSAAGRGATSVGLDDAAILGIAAVFLVGGYHLIIVAMRSGDASIVSPFRYTSILWAVVLGYAVWGDVPNAAALAGIAIVIASGLYLMHRERVLRRAMLDGRRPA